MISWRLLPCVALGLVACGEPDAGEPIASHAQGLTQELLLPFPPGHTWYICQSYVGFSHQSNQPLDIGWTQQSCNAGNNDSGGRPIVAPGDGVISHMPNTLAGGDFMCLSLTGGGAIVLGHVKPEAGIGQGSNVVAGQQVATVRTSTDPNAQNAGIAHLHFEAWSGNNCYTGAGQAFTGAWKMQCAPDLPFNAQYGHYNGTPLTPCPLDRTEHDVTGDGRADLVSARDDGSAYVWPGKADGTFGPAVSSFNGTLDASNADGAGHYIVGVSDVTGDGRADLVSVHDDGSAYVWPGQASGAFGSAVASLEGFDLANLDGSGHQVVGVADVTGDGRADLVSARDGDAYVHEGLGSGGFGDPVLSFAGTLDVANHDGVGHYLLGVADVTGDGRADLVTAHDDGNVYVYPGQTSGAFGAYVESFEGAFDLASWDGAGHWVVDVADVSGDGRADLVTVHDGSAYVWPGQASGAFGDPVESFGGTLDFRNLDGSGDWLAGVGDIDGDDRGDLVAMGDDGNVSVWPGEASGSFGAAMDSFDGTMDFANIDGSGHYIVAPNGPDGAQSPSSSTSSSTSSGASSSSATAGSGGGTTPLPVVEAEAEAEGCACRAASSGGRSAAAWWWLVALVLWRARVRRPRLRGERGRGCPRPWSRPRPRCARPPAPADRSIERRDRRRSAPD